MLQFPLVSLHSQHTRTKNSLISTISKHLLHGNSTNRFLKRVEPSSKEHHHGGAGRRSSSMVIVLCTTPSWEPLWKGLTKGGVSGFTKQYEPAEKKLLFNSTIYFSIFTSNRLIMPPKQLYCASPTLPDCRTFPPYSPPLRPPVFGWLLHVLLSIGGRLRPRCISYIFLFCHYICCPK